MTCSSFHRGLHLLCTCSSDFEKLFNIILSYLLTFQADVEQKKKRTFRKFTYRGVDLDQLLDMS